MDTLSLDLRQLDRLDVVRLGRPIIRPVSPTAAPAATKAAVKSALDFGQRFDSGLAVPREAVRVSDVSPTLRVLSPASARLPSAGAILVPFHSGLTMAVGLGATAAVGMPIGVNVSIAASAGFYGSTTREFGFFHSVGVGLSTTTGAGWGPVISYILGPPSDFADLSIAVGADMDIPGCSASAALLFSVTVSPGLPLPAVTVRFFGVSFALMAGVSVAPVSLSLQVSQTNLVKLSR